LTKLTWQNFFKVKGEETSLELLKRHWLILRLCVSRGTCITICLRRYRETFKLTHIARQRSDAVSMEFAWSVGHRWQYACNQLLVCLVSDDNKCFSISAPHRCFPGWSRRKLLSDNKIPSHRKHANEKIRAGFRLDPALGCD